MLSMAEMCDFSISSPYFRPYIVIVCSTLTVHILSSKRLLKNTFDSCDIVPKRRYGVERNGLKEGTLPPGHIFHQFALLVGTFTLPE